LGLGYIEKADRLEELVYYDQLTGLANQTLVEDRLKQAISRAAYSTRIVATLVVNILRLRQVNDLLGRGAGDAVIRAVGERIATAVRSGDTVGRLGAYDFVVVLVDIASAGDLPEIVRKVQAAVPQSVHVDGDEVAVRARIGVAVFPRDGQSAGELIRNASLAVGGASSAEGPEIVFYSSAADEVAQQTYVVERELRRAIDQKELFLEYQPIMTLPHRKIERVEALLRWKNERLGLVRPDRFIPIAEESGQINKIGAWVIEEASRQGCLWSDALKRPLRVAVNVSPRQLRTPGFAELVAGTVQRISANREHFRFEVEITESAVMDNINHAVAVLEILKAAGITVSIDDFGTGHSSLSRLRALPIDSLKIDRSFVHDLETDANAEAVAKSIVALAHSLGLRVVAEGVETDGQLELLSQLGCDMAQGFLLGRPMSADQLSRLL
jgi:diguanylate cyclase (GGDEF)-like protein